MDVQKNTRLTIDMPVIEHKKLKALAALQGVSLKDLVLSCVRDNLLSENVPNEESLKAFKDTDEGKSLVRCKNVDEMLEKLDLE